MNPNQERLPCDGTVQDYRRHMKHQEKPCLDSKKAWAAYIRNYRRTGGKP